MKKIHLKCSCGAEMIAEEADEMTFAASDAWIDKQIKDFNNRHAKGVFVGDLSTCIKENGD